MNTRRSRLVFSVCVCLLALASAASSALLGCSDDTDAKPDAAGPTTGTGPSADGGGDGGPTDPALGDPPGAPGNVMAAPTLVTTFAGSGTVGFDDGPASQATFYAPLGITVGKAGSLYVADSANNAVRAVAPNGDVSTIAGNGPDAGGFLDDDTNNALFDKPAAVAVDDDGNVYIADGNNNRIRMVSQGGVTTLLADADAGVAGAVFNGPKGVALVDTTLYISDTGNQNVRYIALDTQIVAPVAGSSSPAFADGSGTAASFHSPNGLAIDGNGIVFVADTDNHRIRRIDSATVTTPAGSGTPSFADGTGAAAAFNAPTGVAVDGSGNVFVADSGNNRIRKMTPAGVVTTIAGSSDTGLTDGPGTLARFNRPTGIAVDAAGSVYVSDTDNHRIRKIFTVGPGQLVVSWSLPTSGGRVTGFKVTATAAGQPDATCATTAATMCTLTGLASGVSYSVSVVAMSGTKVGAPSAPATGTAD